MFKAVHSLSENKTFGHHPHTMRYVCANFCFFSAICGFWGSSWRRMCSFFGRFWPIFGVFLQILPQLKTFSKSLCACIILVVTATFVPNLTFLDFLSPEISFGEKNSHPHRHTPTDPDRHPAYFAVREPQCSELRNNVMLHIRCLIV